MRLETMQLLDELRNITFFRRFEQPNQLGLPQVATWDAAMEACATPEWESVRLMAMNRTSTKGSQSNWYRFQEWNPTSDKLRPEVVRIADAAIEGLASSRRIAEKLKHCVRWDLLLILLEKEFEDTVAPLFHHPRLHPIYQAGHFPCGWTGPYLNTYWSVSDDPIPDGDILVF